MVNNNILIDKINEVETDFRAEIIAAEMIENDVPADRILIVPLGAFNRPQSKDIDTIEQEISDYDKKEFILIKTHKEGLYDKLPEGLFHNPISYASDKTEKQVIEAIKRHRIEEKLARTFFLPFDAGINNVRVAITLYEIQLDKKFHFNQLVNIFSPHWKIFEFLNSKQANLFLQFLPLIHKLRDDWQAIEGFFELMFDVPTKLSLSSRSKEVNSGDSSNGYYSYLGSGALGVNITTGHCLEAGDFDEMVITFGPMAVKRIDEFTGEKEQENVALLLCDYLLPADLDINVTYELLEHDRTFTLGDEINTGSNCEMGVSVYL